MKNKYHTVLLAEVRNIHSNSRKSRGIAPTNFILFSIESRVIQLRIHMCIETLTLLLKLRTVII